MMSSIWKRFSKRQRKWMLWSVVLFVTYTVVGFFILPPIIRAVAVSQLSKQLDRSVSIRQVRLNPFKLSVAVEGLSIQDKDGDVFASWERVFVDFQIVSLVSRAWTFKEISTSQPYVRVQMNRDGSFNFSDIVNRFATNSPAPAKAKPAKPLIIHVDKLQIQGASAALADFTTREPFKRHLGPLDITLENFDTDPDNKNPYSFTGTTDAGEKLSWSGFFYLDPLRSQGELKLVDFSLNKYAALYQDLVRFQIRDGVIATDLKYHFELSATNREAVVEDASFALHHLKIGAIGDTNNTVDLGLLGVSEVTADLPRHTATVGAIRVQDVALFLQRQKDQSVNVVEMARPADTATNVSGGVLFLLRSVTNVVSMLLDSTNQWRGGISSVAVTNVSLHLEDWANERPARLDLTDLSLDAKNISNIPGTNLTAALALRWNTNGSIRVETGMSFQPPTAEVRLDLDRLDLGTLDPYLEPKLNLYILGSQVGLHGVVKLRTPANELPQVTFQGDANLDAFHTVDGVMAEDLVKWDRVAFQGVDANLNPPSVEVREILADGVYARLIVETNHTINLLNALRLTPATNAPDTNAVAVKAAETTNTALPHLAIGALVITNTTLSFTDRTIAPEANLSVRSVNGTLAGLSTEQLQHADLIVNAKVDGVGPVALTGTLNPFSGTLTNHLKVAVNNVDLTAVSPYAGKFAGYRISEGKLQLDLAYELVGDQLSAKNVITLDQFTFGEHVESAEATHLPVRLAVAILKDRDGKIVLDVPIAGRLGDPKFRLGKVITRAVVNILEKVATSPFSLLGAVFGGGGEELGYQEFNPGSAELTPVDRQKLDALSKALYARPALRLEITAGIDPDADCEGLQRAALERDMRRDKWQKLRQAEQATNSVEQLAITPEERKQYIQTFYGAALASGKISPQFTAEHTNLVTAASKVYIRPATVVKGATLLTGQGQAALAADQAAANAAIATTSKLVPPPDPLEAVLMAMVSVGNADFEQLAAERTRVVRDYLQQQGKVEPTRLFIKATAAENLRRDGRRVWLQFQ